MCRARGATFREVLAHYFPKHSFRGIEPLLIVDVYIVCGMHLHPADGAQGVENL